jgi:hypothetical protein
MTKGDSKLGPQKKGVQDDSLAHKKEMSELLFIGFSMQDLKTLSYTLSQKAI